MKSYKEFIAEKHISTLYHATTFVNGVEILTSGTFMGSRLKYKEARITAKALGLNIYTYDDQTIHKMLSSRGWNYYASFARSPMNNFFMDAVSTDDLMFVLKVDARKLANRGKIVPVTFFQGGDAGFDEYRGEQEERFLFKDPDFKIGDAIIDVALVGEIKDASVTHKIKQEYGHIKDFTVKRDPWFEGAGMKASLVKFKKARF
jgi:hypothetical protein